MNNIKNLVHKLLRLIPYVNFLDKEYRNSLLLPQEIGHRPGHFYSTIPSVDDVQRNEKRNYNGEHVADVDLNLDQQYKLLCELQQYYASIPFDFNDKMTSDLRYLSKDAYYRYSDVVFLYSIIRHFKPSRIVEIGSGHSSAVMLDVNEIFFNNSILLLFIEPFPEERLHRILRKDDREIATIIKSVVQDVDMSHFEKLKEDDILFIDSSHVSKVGSDVNHIIFSVLPSLAPGVLIHFHDIFYPFDLPKHWIAERKWFWNENYLVRALLMNNKSYEILAFNSLLHREYFTWFQKHMPGCLVGMEDTGSLWIRKK